MREIWSGYFLVAWREITKKEELNSVAEKKTQAFKTGTLESP